MLVLMGVLVTATFTAAIKQTIPTVGCTWGIAMAITRPGEIRFIDVMPKTRSGKIMRRLLRNLAAGEEIAGGTSTLEDRTVLEKLRG